MKNVKISIIKLWAKIFVCLLGPGKPGSYLILLKKKKKFIYEPNASVAVLGAPVVSISLLLFSATVLGVKAASISFIYSLSYLAASFIASLNFIYIILINFLIRLIPLLSFLAKYLSLLYLLV